MLCVRAHVALRRRRSTCVRALAKKASRSATWRHVRMRGADEAAAGEELQRTIALSALPGAVPAIRVYAQKFARNRER